MPNIIFVSSEHKIGIENVVTSLVDICKEKELESIEKEEIVNEKKPINIAIVGRPNVGKVYTCQLHYTKAKICYWTRSWINKR